MIMISEPRNQILEAIFDSEMEVSELVLDLEKKYEKIKEEQVSVEEQLTRLFIGDDYDKENYEPFEDPDNPTEEELEFIDYDPHRIQLDEWIRKFRYAIAEIEKDLKTSKMPKAQMTKNKKGMRELIIIEKAVMDLQTDIKKTHAELVKIKKGTTSGMIEDHGVNRKTFTDNIDSLVEDNLIEESLTEKHGDQTWKYYKTTILGKVLLSKNHTVVAGDGSINQVWAESERTASSEDELSWNSPRITFFYNYLERLKKFDLYEAQIQEKQMADDLELRQPDLLLYQLNIAMEEAFEMINIEKLEPTEFSSYYGHKVRTPNSEYGVSFMVPTSPEASGYNTRLAPMTEHEMRYQREMREENYTKRGPVGEKGWFVNITAYFSADGRNPKTGKYEEEMRKRDIRNMFDFIEDVLTFNFLVILKITTANLEAASPATEKLFKDPDLRKFYKNMLNELKERSNSLNSYLKKCKLV